VKFTQEIDFKLEITAENGETREYDIAHPKNSKTWDKLDDQVKAWKEQNVAVVKERLSLAREVITLNKDGNGNKKKVAKLDKQIAELKDKEISNEDLNLMQLDWVYGGIDREWLQANFLPSWIAGLMQHVLDLFTVVKKPVRS